MTWNDKRVETLKRLWADGLSASQIAARLGGVTRNAVIAKVHRLGVAQRSSTPRFRRAARRSKLAPPSLTPQLARDERGRLELVPLPAPMAGDVARVSALDLLSTHCKWPVGDPPEAGAAAPLFCGLVRVPGLPYCPDHCLRAYTTFGPRQRSPPRSHTRWSSPRHNHGHPLLMPPSVNRTWRVGVGSFGTCQWDAIGESRRCRTRAGSSGTPKAMRSGTSDAHKVRDPEGLASPSATRQPMRSPRRRRSPVRPRPPTVTNHIRETCRPSAPGSRGLYPQRTRS